VRELALNWQFLTKIWKPDTVFLNGQRYNSYQSQERKKTRINVFINVVCAFEVLPAQDHGPKQIHQDLATRPSLLLPGELLLN
jgi:hypothetical protein